MAKILIVDDSDVLRMELREVLEEGGHDVIEGINGLEGYEQAHAHADIDLIITDLNMPAVDGISMCNKIRAANILLGVPIFMLTTESSMELKMLGKEAGIIVWIVKPFTSDKVLSAVTKVLNSVSTAA